MGIGFPQQPMRLRFGGWFMHHSTENGHFQKKEIGSEDFLVQRLDGMPCRLKSPYDFSFLQRFGRVFKVYDDQDSGYICFGMEDKGNRRFVKFAGASAVRSRVSAAEAVARMKTTVPVYRDLAHPLLTRLLDSGEIGAGYAMVFEWAHGECMGRQYPMSRVKFMQMPVDARLGVFDEVLTFHAHVASQGYVAVDFYDGCILYDFRAGKTTLCDVEFYARMPYVNPIGRMWGSSRFMSPEEYRLGNIIDEVTNVYTMGATAFALFGDERDRHIEKWTLNRMLYGVAKRAVSDERNERYQSIPELMQAWRTARGTIPGCKSADDEQV